MINYLSCLTLVTCTVLNPNVNFLCSKLLFYYYRYVNVRGRRPDRNRDVGKIHNVLFIFTTGVISFYLVISEFLVQYYLLVNII